MENIKAKKVLSVVLIVIISILVACIIYMSVTRNTIYELFKSNNEVSDNKQDVKKEEVLKEEDEKETTENISNNTIDPYANYEDKTWSRTTSIDSSEWGVKANIVEVSGVKKVQVQLINMETKKVSKQWYASEITGTPKYIARTLSCAGHRAIAVLTTEGSLYVLTSVGEGEAPTYKQKFVKLQFSEKILEILVTKDIVMTSCKKEEFYFLTENGKLINKDGITWEVKNPYVDVLEDIYIYADKTIACEINGSLTKLKYNGSNVIVNKCFHVVSYLPDYSTGFYFVDSNNNLLFLDDNNKLKLYKSGVESVLYPHYSPITTVIHQVTVTFSDGSTQIFGHADLKNGNYTEIFK